MGFNVLIVDDSSAMRKIIKKTIQISGFDVDNFYEAGNGIEALKVLENNWVDIVLTDINMPEMDGITLIKKLRQSDIYKGIPIVVISTESRDKKVQESLAIGANDYIRKPFKPEEIKDTLIKLMGEEYVRTDDEEMEGFGETDF